MIATGRYARLWRAVQETISVNAGTSEACVPNRELSGMRELWQPVRADCKKRCARNSNVFFSESHHVKDYRCIDQLLR